MNISPQLVSLQALITGRLFRIPQYQRAYSWTTKERRDLFSDIERTYQRKADHFMATIVGLRREPRVILATEYAVVDVVDGQQRLTTLVVLLKAIERQLAAIDDPASQAVASELRGVLVKADEVAPVLLQTNHDASSYCLTYLWEGTHPASTDAKTIADRELLKAFEDCEQFVAGWASGGKTLIELVALLRNRLFFILHEITDESLVYSVFEVLNSRGLDVSWFDRLKSILMGIAFDAATGNASEAIDQLHNTWREIYACIGLRQGLRTEALRFAATLLAQAPPSRPLAEEEAVSVLRHAAGGTAKGAIDVSRWVLKVTSIVDQLQGDRRLDGVTNILQARLVAVAIMLRDDLTPADRNTVLGAWERVSFRIYGLYRRDARTKVGDYSRLAWSCYKEKPAIGALLDAIHGLGKEYPIEKGVEQLRDSDCYNGWTGELRYLMFRYEEHLAAKAGQKFDNEQWSRIWEDSPSRSIEHICPQSAGEHEPSKGGIFVHRLGNLVLLPPGVNSSLGKKSPADKRETYVKTGLLIGQDVAGRIPEWNRAAVEAREEELLAWAAAEWGDAIAEGSAT
ncbi:MAG: DUF262 domain-containing protein [Dehalococcoidia bacterium]